MALSISFPAEKLIRMGQMNDASEVLEAILRRMHDSFTYRADYLAESHERNCSGSWDCANDECIAHDMFGADVHERMICYNCGLESRQQKYTSFLHYINACSLNYAMRICPGNSFDDILKAVMMDVHRTCDPDVGGCGKSNHMSHTLSSSPYVFTVGKCLSFIYIYISTFGVEILTDIWSCSTLKLFA
uniref:Peptidase C19 ubiquitin carboxyl-terminal hydrolase domain-containing protein n=2 Tax=Aegilops tauschii subsp. strangulata TaxID=200361 RepID=A0A453KN50_AEGTS